jgi:hypothetical protein
VANTSYNVAVVRSSHFDHNHNWIGDRAAAFSTAFGISFNIQATICSSLVR